MMLKIKIILVTLVLSGLFFCQRESLFQPDTGFQEMKNPREVIFNLQKAYNERNLEQYLACLATDFQCLSENSQWNKYDEQFIHQNMFQDHTKVKKINLILTEVGSATTQAAKLTYHYKLQLYYDDGFSDEAEGQVLFHFKEIMNHRWQISHWEERNYLNKTRSQNSTDYFPLQVGNWWYYEPVPRNFEWDYRYRIIDTVRIENKLYHIREEKPMIADSQHYVRLNYFRQDSSGQIWCKETPEMAEQILFKLNSKPYDFYDEYRSTKADTWYYHDKRNQQLLIFQVKSYFPEYTPIGVFNNCKIFAINESPYSSVGYIMAADIGIISMGGEGVSFEIKRAKVNGILYLPIDALERLTWHKIKKGFIMK